MDDRSTITLSEPTARGELLLVQDLILVMRCDRLAGGSRRIALAELDRVDIGRSPAPLRSRDGAVAVDDPSMSQLHARLHRRGARWVLEDAGSKNGTLVNGIAHTQVELADNDLVELGQCLFVYRSRRVAAEVADAVVAAEPALDTFVPALAARFAELARIAPSSIPIVVRGETGAGKEVVSNAVHRLSRRSGPLVAVNCAALADSIIEAELFGHRRGAFSDAREDRPGLVRSADGGTLLLDEIGDLSPAGQGALLRVIEQGEVLSVGASRPVPVDVRVIAATHRDLGALVEAGTFRADLLARLAGFTIVLPALRERREDLGLVVAALVARLGPTALTRRAGRALLSYHWPLNVRELAKCLASARLLAGDRVIDDIDLPAEVRAAGATATPAPRLAGADDEALRGALVELLQHHAGNVSAIARATGRTRMQIHRWARRTGIDLRSFRSNKDPAGD